MAIENETLRSPERAPATEVDMSDILSVAANPDFPVPEIPFKTVLLELNSDRISDASRSELAEAIRDVSDLDARRRATSLFIIQSRLLRSAEDRATLAALELNTQPTLFDAV